MAHNHEHTSHLQGASSKPLIYTLIIILVIMFAEFIGGILSNSLALVGDAGHMLVDALALGLAVFAISVARRPATVTRTFGYHRVEIMAALANGVTLVLLSFVIFYESYQRFLHPTMVRTPLMLVIATIGLISNIVGIILLRRGSQELINIKAAFWHILGDTISSLGVIAAGLIITFTGFYIADPIIAVVMATTILWGAIRIVRESADILLEAVPRQIQLEKVVEALQRIIGVQEVHDIHIWTITSGIYALSAHLMIEDQMVSRSADIIQAVNQDLAGKFNINHTTLQLECSRCESCPSGFICSIHRPEV